MKIYNDPEICLSVIVPCYNAEDNIVECIDSIVKSNLNCHFEVVVINDKSTDDSAGLIAELCRKDGRIALYHTPGLYNLGPSGARNVGLDMSSGKYIVFVDSDDQVKPDFLNDLYENILNNDKDLVVTGYTELNNKSFPAKHIDFSESSILNKKSMVKSILSGTGGMVWGRIYNANIIRENKIRFDEDLNLSEDMVFNLDFIRFADKFGFEENYGYIYDRTDDNGLSKFDGSNYFAKQIKLLTILEAKLPSLGFLAFEVRQVILRKTFSAYYTMLYKYCEMGFDYSVFLFSFEHMRKLNLSKLNLSGISNLLIIKFLTLNSPLLSISFMKTYQLFSKMKKIIKKG